jgi:hypothetical protein
MSALSPIADIELSADRPGFYVHGIYFGAAPTKAEALQAAKAALERWDFKTMKRIRPPRA